MIGLLRADLRIKPLVNCRFCPATDYSADSFALSFKYEHPVEIARTLQAHVEATLPDEFVQPPVGWSVEGRGNYRCPACKSCR